jgi:hypothetical protein
MGGVLALVVVYNVAVKDLSALFFKNPPPPKKTNTKIHKEKLPLSSKDIVV